MSGPTNKKTYYFEEWTFQVDGDIEKFKIPDYEYGEDDPIATIRVLCEDESFFEKVGDEREWFGDGLSEAFRKKYNLKRCYNVFVVEGTFETDKSGETVKIQEGDFIITPKMIEKFNEAGKMDKNSEEECDEEDDESESDD